MHTEKKYIYVYVYTHVHLCAFLGYCSINECFSLNLVGEDKNLDPLFKFLEDICIYIHLNCTCLIHEQVLEHLNY